MLFQAVMKFLLRSKFSQNFLRKWSKFLGKQSQSGNICFTVGQYWLIIKINGTNSVYFAIVGNSVNFVGNTLSNRNFSESLLPPSGKFF
jgi:hypothetical protein